MRNCGQSDLLGKNCVVHASKWPTDYPPLLAKIVASSSNAQWVSVHYLDETHNNDIINVARDYPYNLYGDTTMHTSPEFDGMSYYGDVLCLDRVELLEVNSIKIKEIRGFKLC